jgi:hypothetical protein
MNGILTTQQMTPTLSFLSGDSFCRGDRIINIIFNPYGKASPCISRPGCLKPWQ